MQKVDIAIVGAGMVGLTLAAALANSALRVAVISQAPLAAPIPDQPLLRVSAINQVNQQALAELGVWQRLPDKRVAGYRHMHVWDKDSFGHIHFDASDLSTDNLGYIIENQVLTNALAEQVDSLANVVSIQAGVDKILTGEQETMLMLDNDDVIACQLLVGADGANSMVRRHAGFPITFRDYAHNAIVATVKTAQPHGATARQVFTPQGPLALLPLADPHLCSIVWSQQTARAEALMQQDEQAFAQTLTATINSALGPVTLASERHMFTLTMRYARQWADNGVVIVGDAAHTIHPLAGQGANLGMQDALALAVHLQNLQQQGKNISRHRYLRAFERARKTEAMKMVAAMDGFKHLFEGNNPLKKLVRSSGLAFTNQLPAVKRKLIEQAMGW